MDHISAAKESPVKCAARIDAERRLWLYALEANYLQVLQADPPPNLSDEDLADYIEEMDPSVATKFDDWKSLIDASRVN